MKAKHAKALETPASFPLLWKSEVEETTRGKSLNGKRITFVKNTTFITTAAYFNQYRA